jgi:hypothetical protein
MSLPLVASIGSLADRAKWREKLLIEEQDATFRAARDRAATDQERRYWDEFIALRTKNLRSSRNT